ncbi:MAG: histidine kinase [Halanaerobium sp.]
MRNSIQAYLEINPFVLNLFLDLLITGTLLIISISSFLIFAVRSHKLYLLYFSILTFIIASGSLLTAESIKLSSSALSLDISYKLFLLVYLSIPVFILFKAELFPDHFSEKLLVSVNLLTVIFYLLVFILPAEIFRKPQLFNITVLLVFFYILYILFRAAAAGDKKAIPFFLNLSFLSGARLNDLLYAENIIDSIYIFQPSLFIFLIITAVILMKHASDNAANREKELEKLKQENEYLQEKEKLKDEFMIDNLQRLDLPIEKLMASAESILHDGIFINKELRTNLAGVINNSRGLKYLLRNFKDYFQLNLNRDNINEEEIELRSIIDKIINFYKIYLEKKDISIDNKIREDKFLVKVDKANFVMLIFNILDNIILQIDSGRIVLEAEEHSGEIQLLIELKNSKITFKHNNFLNKLQQIDQSKDDKFKNEEKRQSKKINSKIDFKQQKIEESLKSINASLNIEKMKNNNLLFKIILQGELKESYHRAEKNAAALQSLDKGQKSEFKTQKRKIKAQAQPKIIIFSAGESNKLMALESIAFLKEYEIIETENKEEMFSHLSSRTALVVLNIFSLSDVILDYCREVRSRFSIFELPLLIIAARNTPESLIRGFEMGINDFIKKPFEISELKARMITLITLKEKVEESVQREQNYLRAQIKPHFLYNTLDTIAYLCEEDSTAAGELIIDLANYLRYSFDFDNLDQLVSIEKELDLVKFYLSIQQQRFKDKIEVEYNIEKDIEFSLPPLILQSIVENAVKHGITNNEGIGKIKITIRHLSDYYQLEIEDNGIGIDQEELRKLLTEKQHDQADRGRRKIGLENINKRLSRLFDQELQIESRKNEGTKVSFKIPE